MLLLIGSDGNKLDSHVAKRFGHADYYLAYDTSSKNLESFENKSDDHNHENLQEFINKGVEVFIVGNIGPHAFEIVNTSKSKVYLARKMTVKAAIEKFQNNELKHLTEPTAKRSIGHDHHHSHTK